MPRGRQPLFPLFDRILGGKLAEQLAAWRAEDLSFDAIARRLGAEHDIEVTGETVRRWCIDLEIPEAVA